LEHDYANVTLDLSHTSTAGVDGFVMAQQLGDRLCHLHLTDGTGSPRDEHLVPGRGDQRSPELLEYLAGRGFTGNVVVEISTRRATTRGQRLTDLAESLAFARLHLAAPDPSFVVDRTGTVSPVSRRRSRSRRSGSGG
jgi:sugar phosphate isomerase/epimerase